MERKESGYRGSSQVVDEMGRMSFNGSRGVLGTMARNKNENEKKKRKKTEKKKREILALVTLTRKPWRTCTLCTANPGSFRRPLYWVRPSPYGKDHLHIRCVLHEATKPLQMHEDNLICSALLFHFRTSLTHPHRIGTLIYPYLTSFWSSINEILLS